ncbi:HipA domain-containing protein [Acinetobacter faecalis]|uniref:hypothetical protein n=1 Tax=Acinetobacter faecalis TaxID=2665161 RepID=UPI002A9132C8|nr:hypothetical protein [Acinetobacter faecalis]MDY6456709.1 hypothetical protein [Acinetobacter faecalis]
MSHLAPSYDHGASLARNLSDVQREQRLTSKDKGQHISQFVLKSKSWFLDRGTNKRLKSLETFKQYALMEKAAANSWLKILDELNDDQIYLIISKVPDKLMSKISKDFTFKLIQCNKLNLLSLSSNFKDE